MIVLISIIAVVTGPLHTLILLSVPERILYWGLTVLLAFFAARFILRLLAPWLHNAQSWKIIASNTLCMGLFYTPFIYGWTNLMVPPVDEDSIAIGRFLSDVLLIALAAFTTVEIVMKRKAAKAGLDDRHHEAEPAPVALPDIAEKTHIAETTDIPEKTQIPRVRLLRRIDAEDPGPILRLEALDHFVTVVTAAGQYHLRMRFADAIDEMDGVEGLRTHRSHWVVRAAIIGAERENRRLFMHVACGARIPVSRKHLPDVEATGLV